MTDISETGIAAEAAAHVLVVDDDRRLAGLIGHYLAEQGFRVSLAHDAKAARTKLAGLAFDLLVLDIMMPGESGLDLARDLRRTSAVPILLLTAMGESENRIAGLESGADDYLTKPFEPKELVLRIQAILKRAKTPPVAAQAAIVSFGGYHLEIDKRRLYKGEAPVHLTESEMDLLVRLARRAGQSLSREDLAESGGHGDLRQVDVQMTRLRRKVETDPRFPRYLQTVRGIGYILQPD